MYNLGTFVQELKKMEKDCAQKKKKMDDELKRIEEATAGYESMGMEIAGLKEELEEAKAALEEASQESVDSQLQGFMDECNALKEEIQKVTIWCYYNCFFFCFLHSILGWVFKSLQCLRTINSWPFLAILRAIILSKRMGYMNL